MSALRHFVPMQPLVAWHVGGRKLFDSRVSPRIRAMWKVGAYAVSRHHPIPARWANRGGRDRG